MILIADGGSTSCDWAVVDRSNREIVCRFQSQGLNPYATTEQTILSVLTDVVAKEVAPYTISEIHFYGAGVTEAKSPLLCSLIERAIPAEIITAQSDMECAAKALVGNGEGIVAILGTGSNSAYYKDGQKALSVPALGYILGDEGGGAVMGRMLLSDIFKGVAPQHIIEQFYAQYNIDQAELLQRVYRTEGANRYLASFTKFLSARLDDNYIYALVERCFESFVRRNLAQYPIKDLYAVGSIAYHFKGVLQRVAEREGYNLIKVVQSPIDSLAEYYTGTEKHAENSEPSAFRKITEESSYYTDLESMSVGEALRAINREDSRVADAVSRCLPQIEELVSQLIPRLKQGGRLFYMGAGTSGRLGVLDASEVPPTFGMPPTVIIGIIAGGDKALRTPVEGAEDDTEQGWRDLEPYNPTPLDTVVGIAASGTTPYVVGVLSKARENGLLTASIASNRNSPAAASADIAIETVVGPEFVTGSSRMKSGTAQKLVCNMITTTAMIGIGRVRGNRMVNMQLTNKKLLDRGTKMLVDYFGIDYEQARNLLLLHGSVERARVWMTENQEK